MSQKVIIQLLSLPDGVKQRYTRVRKAPFFAIYQVAKGEKQSLLNEVCQLLKRIGVNLINLNPAQWKHFISVSLGAFSHSDYRTGKWLEYNLVCLQWSGLPTHSVQSLYLHLFWHFSGSSAAHNDGSGACKILCHQGNIALYSADRVESEWITVRQRLNKFTQEICSS